ncbi:MAG: hypothetical protein V8R49_02505 [Duodenibacillus massiliensis]
MLRLYPDESLMKAGVAASAAATVGIPITPVAGGAAAEADAGIRLAKGRLTLLRHGLRPAGRHPQRPRRGHQG